MITRLDFKLEEFVRVSWVSSRARDKWGSIFQDLSYKFGLIERQSVSMGQRRIALQQTGDIIGLTKDMMLDKLTVLPLEKVNKVDRYVSASQPFDPKLPQEFKVAIGSSRDLSKFIGYYHGSDDEKIGHYLGYPPCCIAFFNLYWKRDKWFDTTLPMLGENSKQTEIFHELDPRNNILLRWLGLRTVSHLPCSFGCKATRQIADMNEEAAGLIGLGDNWDQLLEILSWPIEWNSLHGIAQIITPVCKITTASDALPEKRTVRLVNNKIPLEAGTGVEFPFIRDVWTDNGFPSYASMSRAHEKIIEALLPYRPKSVLDLGCGNMELLRRIHAEFGSYTWGIDEDYKKSPDVAWNIFDLHTDALPRDFDFAIIAAQRSVENPEGFQKLIEKLAPHVKNLMVYDYITGETNVRSFQGAL